MIVAGLATGLGAGCNAGEGPVPHVVPASPQVPVAMTIPSQPIVPGSGDLGYLPGSGAVGPAGQWTYEIPIDAGPARMGMRPTLSLRYDSTGGNSVAGVGWMLSGLSSITRCPQTFATEGHAQGVTYTDFSNTPDTQRDRFCLDGQKLMAVAGGYGQDGTQYRTEEDVYSDIQSTGTSSEAKTQGPDQFTVQTKDGTTLVYRPITTQRWSSTASGTTKADQVRTVWLLALQFDRSQNGVEYHYKTFSDAADAQQTVPSEIDFTTFGSNGDGTATKPGSRKVVFTYDDSRPDQEFGWHGGAPTRLLERLSAITVYAPDPGQVMPVWTYRLEYAQSKDSKRSLLSSVQRCANKNGSATAFGGCTWKKEFHWTGAGTPTFTTKDVLGPIGIAGIATDVWQQPTPQDYSSSGTGAFAVGPYLQVFDADGDGADDVMLQPGALPQTLGFTGPAIAPPMMLTSTHDGGGVQPLAQTWDLQKHGGAYKPPLVVYSYNPSYGTGNSDYTAWGNWLAPLERVYALDIEAKGRAGIFLQDYVFDSDGVADGRCADHVLDWQGAQGFVDSGLKFPSFDCSAPNIPTQFAQFLDFDGDGRLDYMQADVQPHGGGDPGPSASNPSWQNIPGEWQMMLNEGGHFAASGSAPVGTSLTAGCPAYVVDFDGRGHGAVLGQVGTDIAYAQAQGQPLDIDGTVHCGSAAAMIWSPFTNQWTRDVDGTQSMPPLVTGLSTTNGGGYYGVVSPVSNGTFEPSFGDYNGDGLEDVIWVDPSGKGVFLRWNTGNGFGPATQIPNAQWAVLDLSQWAPFHPPTFQIRVADMNGDGRADLVVFHMSPAQGVTMMLSNGDGTFASVDVGGSPGVLTALGWTTSRIGDFNGDGYPDIIRLAEVSGSTNDFGADYGDCALVNVQLLLQKPQMGDLMASVQDEPTTWARETLTYSTQWSDKPESNAACTYPQSCQKVGATPLVRELDLRDGLTDPTSAQVDAPHRIFMSYEDPVSDLRGRGPLGFRKVRAWDVLRMTQTVTEYDNRTELHGKYYPGAEQPVRETTVVALPSPGTPQKMPVLPASGATSTYARVTQTDYTRQLVRTHGGATYALQPEQVSTTEWEQSVMMTASPTDPADPTSDYVWNFAVPATPLRVHTSSIVPAKVDGSGIVTQYGDIDAYGNVTKQTELTHGGETVVTHSKYDNLTSGGKWQLGLLRFMTVVATEADGTTDSRVAAYDYDAQGLLKTAYRQMNAAAPVTVSTTTLTRDPYGNVVSLVTQGPNPLGGTDTRQVNVEYAALWPGQPDERIFPSQTWVPVSLPGPNGSTWAPSEWTLVHPAYGVTIDTMDANGVQTTATYDDLGRLRTAVTDGDAQVKVSYSGRPDAHGGQNGMIATTTVGGQTKQTMTDADGRTVLTTQLDFDGQKTDTQILRDLLGRVASVSRPYPDSINPEYFATHAYDGLDRLVQTVHGDGTKTLVAPTFFTTTTTDPNGNLSAVGRDVDGRTVLAQNWLTQGTTIEQQFLLSHWITTKYHRYPFGLIDIVTDPDGNAWTTHFDGLGREIGSRSPDAGSRTNVQYDAFDELLQSTHAESGAVTSSKFDVLGRLTSWGSTDGPTGATYTYDTQPDGLGKLATSLSSDQVLKRLSYDVHGRSTGYSETIDGETYAIGLSYYASGSSQGLLQQVTYPSVAGSAQPGMTLTYDYTGVGYISHIQYRTSAMTSAAPLYTVTGRDLDGSLLTAYGGAAPGAVQWTYAYLPSTGQTQEIKVLAEAGTGYAYDRTYEYYPNGLVEATTEKTTRRADSFTYDSVSRMTSSTVTALPPCTGPGLCAMPPESSTLGYAYGDGGNLTQVTQQLLSGASTVLENNTYGVTAGPHALTTHEDANGSTNGQYDTHGRLNAIDQRTVNYNAHDLPTSVTDAKNIWTFEYDADAHRAKKESMDDGTTVYVGDFYEHRTGGTAGPEDVFMVPGIAQIDVVGGGAPQVSYLVTDAQGSVNVVLDAAGAKPPERFFYGPFGDLQNSDGTPYSGTDSDVRTQFTGQESDADFKAIDFKGRLYEPNLKRFFTADPHVTYPAFGQSWNPYSYVYNSPPNVTDPTGYDGTGEDYDIDTPPDQSAIDQALPWVGAGKQIGTPTRLFNYALKDPFLGWTVATTNGTVLFSPTRGAYLLTPGQSTNNNGGTANYVGPSSVDVTGAPPVVAPAAAPSAAVAASGAGDPSAGSRAGPGYTCLGIMGCGSVKNLANQQFVAPTEDFIEHPIRNLALMAIFGGIGKAGAGMGGGMAVVETEAGAASEAGAAGGGALAWLGRLIRSPFGRAAAVAGAAEQTALDAAIARQAAASARVDVLQAQYDKLTIWQRWGPFAFDALKARNGWPQVKVPPETWDVAEMASMLEKAKQELSAASDAVAGARTALTLALEPPAKAHPYR